VGINEKSSKLKRDEDREGLYGRPVGIAGGVFVFPERIPDNQPWPRALVLMLQFCTVCPQPASNGLAKG
jgi:hypothetical protein